MCQQHDLPLPLPMNALTSLEKIIMTKTGDLSMSQAGLYASNLSKQEQTIFVSRSQQLTSFGQGVHVELHLNSLKLTVSDAKLMAIAQGVLRKSVLTKADLTHCVWNDPSLQTFVEKGTITAILQNKSWREDVHENNLHQAAFQPSFAHNNSITTEEVIVLSNLQEKPILAICENDLEYAGIRFVEETVFLAMMQYSIKLRTRRMVEENSYTWHDLTVVMPDKMSWSIVQDKIALKWNVKKLTKCTTTLVGKTTETIYEMMQYHLPENPNVTPDTSPQRQIVVASVKPAKRAVEEPLTTPQTTQKRRRFDQEPGIANEMPVLDLTCYETMSRETTGDNNSLNISNAQGVEDELDLEQGNGDMQISVEDSSSFTGLDCESEMKDFFGYSWLNEDIELMLNHHDDADNAYDADKTDNADKPDNADNADNAEMEKENEEVEINANCDVTSMFLI